MTMMMPLVTTDRSMSRSLRQHLATAAAGGRLQLARSQQLQNDAQILGLLDESHV
jgi:hypothetical protein